MRGGLGTSSDLPASSENSSFRLSAGSRRGSFATIRSSPSYSSLQIVKNVSLSNLHAITEAIPTIRPIEIEEAVAKDISAHGFVLRFYFYFVISIIIIIIVVFTFNINNVYRYVRPDGLSCSRCPWLHGCQGCLIPDSPELLVIIQNKYHIDC